MTSTHSHSCIAVVASTLGACCRHREQRQGKIAAGKKLAEGKPDRRQSKKQEEKRIKVKEGKREGFRHIGGHTKEVIY